jgi:hypothetical protein
MYKRIFPFPQAPPRLGELCGLWPWAASSSVLVTAETFNLGCPMVDLAEPPAEERQWCVATSLRRIVVCGGGASFGGVRALCAGVLTASMAAVRRAPG